MTDFNTMRGAKIAAAAAAFTPPTYAGPPPIVIIGDSHVQAMDQVFGDGCTLGGSPVLFAGIAGATWPILLASIPWDALQAVKPARVFVAGGVNDAIGRVGMDANGNVNATGVNNILSVMSKALTLSPQLVVVSDPSPEEAAGYEPYADFQWARMAYYAATVDWGSFGFTGSPCPASCPLPFVDLHYLLAQPGGTPSTQAYSTPCYTAPGTTEDLVHLTHAAYVAAFADLGGA